MVWVPRWCRTKQEARAREILEGATVLLVEDEDLPRRGWCRYIGRTLRILEAVDVAHAMLVGRSALSDLDLAMVDLALPDGSGWEVIVELHALDPTLRFLVVSGLEETGPPEDLQQDLIDRLLFVDKPTSPAQILAAMAYAYHCVQQERGARDGSDAPERPDVERCPKHEKLSHRESQAMRGCVQGLSNQEIAEQLGVAFSTARKHVSAGFSKLKVSSRQEVARAIERDREAGKCE
jgi:DNA-binding NarL/FixJ family response regulator